MPPNVVIPYSTPPETINEPTGSTGPSNEYRSAKPPPFASILKIVPQPSWWSPMGMLHSPVPPAEVIPYSTPSEATSEPYGNAPSVAPPAKVWRTAKPLPSGSILKTAAGVIP